MIPGGTQPISAFTLKANGIANVLISNVDVHQPIPGQKDKIGKFIAIWDTGATSTVITTQVVEKLGLIPSGKANLKGVAGSKDDVDTYYIIITLPNSVRVNVFKAVEAPSIAGNADILIGMDIIALGDFSVTNVNQKTVFSFRYPSIKTIDYVEEINAEKKLSKGFGHLVQQNKSFITAPTKNHRVDGNLPCPCGAERNGNNVTENQSHFFTNNL